MGRLLAGGEPLGGSNKSDKSEADPGEQGESRSMSTGEPLVSLLDLKKGKSYNSEIWHWLSDMN